MNGFDALLELPTSWLFAIGTLVVVQVVLDVIALRDLYLRPVERVAFGNKWVWVAIILLVSTIGAVLYLLVGRLPAPAVDVTASEPARDRAENAADMLYGAPKGDDRR